MRVRTALAKSKNMVSIRVLQSIGAPYAQEWITRFGFGQKTGIDVDGELTGVLPSTEWKRRFYKRKGFWLTLSLGFLLIATLGAGEDEQRARRGRDGGELLVVEERLEVDGRHLRSAMIRRRI